MKRTILLGASVLALAAPAAHAATIKVTTTADTLTGPGCSLRAAVIAANTDAAFAACKAGAGADVIKLAKSATYTFTIGGDPDDASQRGDLDTTSQITIKGSGATIDAAGLDRVLDVHETGALTLTDATLTGGGPIESDRDQSGGGALRSVGPVTLSHVTLADNAVGAWGMLIDSRTLTITDSTIENNHVQPPILRDDIPPRGVVVGTFTMRRTVVHGPLGSIESSGNATLTDTEISGTTGPAISNSGSMHLTRTAVVDNESGELGDTLAAGIVNVSGELWLDDSTVSHNSVTSATDVDTDRGVQGGGITNSGTLHVSRSTISGNTIVQHCRSNGLFECRQSVGAGIANDGTLDLTNTTVSGNTVDFSCVRQDDDAAPCPTDGGGGIANYGSGTTTAVALTLADNHGGSFGGGVAVLGGSVSLTDSIVADNTADMANDCSGTLAVFAASLLGDPSGCTITSSASSLFGVDPLLGPLQDKGGPTQTMALDPASPAVDAGPAKKRLGCPKTDQRGVKRPQGAGCDIGAYELGAS